MKFPLFIAIRHLVYKKKLNAINIISSLSMIGITIGTAALIIVLSVFNGFEEVVKSLVNSFTADLQITPKKGKLFYVPDSVAEKIKNTEGVIYYTRVLEDNVLLQYQDKQFIATLKGVENDFLKITALEDKMIQGELLIEDEEIPYALLGFGVAYELGLNTGDYFNPLRVYSPSRKPVSPLHPERAFSFQNIHTAGIFSVQKEIDVKYVVAPLSFARDLFEYKTEFTSIELGLKKGADVDDVIQKIKPIVGEEYHIKDRYEQQAFLYKVMRSEKLVVYLILTFILLIAITSVIGSMTMAIIDKRKDIAVLISLGADVKRVRDIFVVEGLVITLGGGIAGLMLGALICWLQQTFGLISLQGAGTFVIDDYPVDMQMMDFIYVFITVFVIGSFAAWYPGRQIINEFKEIGVITNYLKSD